MCALTLQERMSQKVKEKSIEKSVELNNKLVLSTYNFSKLNLDKNTLSFLENKTIEIKKITNKAYTELGKLFFETSNLLSLNGYGCFEQWYTELGFKKQTVYNYINRYKMIVQRLDNQKTIESLPLKMVYEIAKDDCDESLITKVLNLQITTYQELIHEKNKLKNIKENTIELLDSNEFIDYTNIEKEYKNIKKILTKINYENVNQKKKQKIYEYIKKIESLLK